MDSDSCLLISLGYWGTTMVWSPDENKLMYLAERKDKKSEPFWTSYARRKLDDPDATDKENAPRVGDFFTFYTLSYHVQLFAILFLGPRI